jgi:acetyl-CoA synthetase
MATSIDHERLAGSDPLDLTTPWEEAWNEIGGPPGDDHCVNIADRVIDRHVRTGRGEHVALRWFGRDDIGAEHPVDISYQMLEIRTNRFASALRRRGFKPGTGVATLAGRLPELYVAALGTLKADCVYTPLFAAFGPDPIAQRLAIGAVRVLVTTPVLFRRKVVQILDRLPDLELILIIGATEDTLADVPKGSATQSVAVVSFGAFLGEGRDAVGEPTSSPDTSALLHFTSGTTGAPKGALHVHEAVVAHAATAAAVLDITPDDVYWCTADPGWVTGTSYGIFAPLARGATVIVDEADFDADRWYSILVHQQVNVFYTAPTAIRMLQRIGEAAAPTDFPDLRLVASVGEPLDAESVLWATRIFGVPVLDTWWQTETGAIMIANRLGENVRPGSMGRPVPGIEATLLQRDAHGDLVLSPDGDVVEVTDPAASGEIALRVGWPSMFRGYLGREERYRASFVGLDHQWYRSGDLARRDADGYFWFVGRGDDVIKTAGHLIGPFEVESVLDEHPAVAESGVIGKPDATAGSIIKAFVILHDGHEPSETTRSDLIAHCRRRLGAAVAPREIEFVDSLPHTRSGKIMRRLLKARELGESEGDISTLETTPADRNRTDARR